MHPAYLQIMFLLVSIVTLMEWKLGEEERSRLEIIFIRDQDVRLKIDKKSKTII